MFIKQVPSDLNSAVKLIISLLSEEDKSKFVDIEQHFFMGKSIRNSWDLWNKESDLVKWFEKNHGINHADEISGLILYCVECDLKNIPRDEQKIISKFYKPSNNPFELEDEIFLR